MNRLVFFVQRESKRQREGEAKRAERKDRRFLPDAEVSRWRKASENVLMLQLFHVGEGFIVTEFKKTFILVSTVS